MLYCKQLSSWYVDFWRFPVYVYDKNLELYFIETNGKEKEKSSETGGGDFLSEEKVKCDWRTKMRLNAAALHCPSRRAERKKYIYKLTLSD